MKQPAPQLPPLQIWPAPQPVPSRAFVLEHEPLEQVATWHVPGLPHAVQLVGPHP
jgi:hypothetical protein